MKQLNLTLHSNFSFKSVIYFAIFQLLKPTQVYEKHKQWCKNSDTTPKIILLVSPGVLKCRILIKSLKVYKYLRNIINVFIPKYRDCNWNSFLIIPKNRLKFCFLCPEKLYFSSCDIVLLGVRYVVKCTVKDSPFSTQASCSKCPQSAWINFLSRLTREFVILRSTAAFFMLLVMLRIRWSSFLSCSPCLSLVGEQSITNRTVQFQPASHVCTFKMLNALDKVRVRSFCV